MSTFKKNTNISGQQIETYFLFLEQLNTELNFTSSENKTKKKKTQQKKKKDTGFFFHTQGI